MARGRRFARLRVGRRRIGRSVSPLEAGYTRAIRAQMESIERAITERLNAIEGLTPGAVRHALQPIFEESQRLVPVLSGALKDSGGIVVERTARGAAGEVFYARGGNPFYAVIVHERTELQHTAPTQAKFLEEAAAKHGGDVGTRAAQFLRDQLGL